jgi:hypothetical protein
MIKKFSKEKWIKLVKDFDSSNESKINWCKKRGINSKTFGYWNARYSVNSKSKFKIIEEKNIQLSREISKSKPKDNKKDIPVKVAKSDSWVELKIVEPIKTEISKSFTRTINFSHDDSPNIELENIISKPSKIIIKIGKAEIQIEEGFDKSLLIDVSKALGEIC